MELDGDWFLLLGFDFLLPSEFFEPHGFAVFTCEDIGGDLLVGKRCCRRGERAGFEKAGGLHWEGGWIGQLG